MYDFYSDTKSKPPRAMREAGWMKRITDMEVEPSRQETMLLV